MKKRSLILRMLSGIFALIGKAMEHWIILLMLAAYITGIGPHLRTSFAARTVYGHTSYIGCTYLGMRGFVERYAQDSCPWVVVLDDKGERLL